MFFHARPQSLALMFILAFCFAPMGCSRSSAAKMQSFAQPSKAASDAARPDIATIPLPSKNLYLAVREESRWQNPFISVEDNMLLLRIYLPDENTSATDVGGITRPANARKQELNIRLRDLPRALAALPEGSWPYGRVVAVAEGYESRQDRAQIRRNVEVTLQTLRDLGVVVDEWNPNSSLPAH